MERLFYSTGQVAQQLGVTLPTVRLLCENGAIDAERTPGGQWRVRASEIERLKRDGLPPVPRPLPIEAALPARNGKSGGHAPAGAPTTLSDQIQAAEAAVAVARSMLEKRRIDRELEENEDWFREREHQQAAAAAVERQRAEAQRAELQRQRWLQRWTQYALDSVPSAARAEAAIEVHDAVSAALSKVPTGAPEAITSRVVQAAVHGTLRPWKRKQDIERALKSGMDRLPWEVRNRSEYASIKQRTWDAAVEAVGRLREEASYEEMASAAEQVVRPIIHGYEHEQACGRIVRSIYVSDATGEELEAARQAVRQALIALPIGATPNELEKAKEATLGPYKTAIAQRKEAARLESDRQAQRRAAESKVNRQLDHIARYLEQEYRFDGGYAGMLQAADRLRPLIREKLIDRLLKNPGMSDDEIRTRIEKHIDGVLNVA